MKNSFEKFPQPNTFKTRILRMGKALALAFFISAATYGGESTAQDLVPPTQPKPGKDNTINPQELEKYTQELLEYHFQMMLKKFEDQGNPLTDEQIKDLRKKIFEKKEEEEKEKGRTLDNDEIEGLILKALYQIFRYKDESPGLPTT